MEIEDLTGFKNNMLKVIKLDEERTNLSLENKRNGKSKYNYIYWICECDCGNIKSIERDGVKGKTKSCGCLNNNNKFGTSEFSKRHNKFDLTGDFGIGWTTKGQEFHFDLEDYDRVKEICWCKNGDYFAGHDTTTRKQIYLHKFIMNASREVLIDHEDRDTSNNQKSNLRIADYQKNGRNRTISKRNRTGVVGVRIYKKFYMSFIGVDGKDIHLYCGQNFEEAVKARLNAELKYFGIEYSPQRDMFEQYHIQ